MVLSLCEEISFATSDAEMGCTRREVRFDRLCLKLPSIFKRAKDEILSQEKLKRLEEKFIVISI